MTPWKQSFESQKCIETVQAAFKAWEAVPLDGMNADWTEQYARLLKALKVLEHRFSTLDAELFPGNTWGNFGSWLTDIKNKATQFSSSKDVGHIQNANNVIDQALNVLRPIDLLVSSEGAKPIREAAESFQKQAHAEVEKLRSKCVELSKSADALRLEIAQSKTRLDQNNQIIEQQKNRLDQSIAEFQKQFSQAESARTIEFGKSSNRFGQEFTELTGQFKAQFDAETRTRRSDYESFSAREKQTSDSHREFFKKREGEVNEIFGAIGSATLSGHFKNTADADRSAANLFRWISLGLMVAMGVVGVMAFSKSIDEKEIRWEVFALRLGTTLIIALPAIYAAQESTRHRERERLNRKLQLELSSIDAYLALLPEPKQFELKEKLTEKFFGKADESNSEEAITKHALFDLVASVLKNLTKPK